MAAGESAYRDAEEGPIPAEVAAAIVAAMTAAAPLGSRGPVRPPEVEPRVAKPEPFEPEPELVLADAEPELVLADAEPELQLVGANGGGARSAKPYYEIPPPAPRQRRSWRAAEQAQTVAGTATALGRLVRAKTERALARPTPAPAARSR